MTVANSSTDIVNLSLDIIKTENINDVEIPAGNKIAVICNRWYDDVKRNALEGFPWGFASTRASIPLNSTAPAFGFDDAYVLPNDYLSLGFIRYWDYPLSRWDYMIEDGNLLIDNDGGESLDVGYVYDCQEVVKFSPSFKIYLAYALALEVAYKLTGNTSLLVRIENGLKRSELNAKAKNGKSNPPVAYRESKMLAGRRVYKGSSTSGLFGGQNGRT